jgi:hypothetical protein
MPSAVPSADAMYIYAAVNDSVVGALACCIYAVFQLPLAPSVTHISKIRFFFFKGKTYKFGAHGAL